MRVSWTKSLCLASLLASSVTALYIEPAELHSLVARELPQEWRGFDNSERDQQKIMKISQAFRDMDTMSSDEQTALIVLGHYFSPAQKTSGDFTQKQIVLQVLKNMVFPKNLKSHNAGSDFLAGLTIHNALDKGTCSDLDTQGKKRTIAAYTESNDCDTSIYFCDIDRVNPYKYPDLSNLPTDEAQCREVFKKDAKVSPEMTPLAYILIHELTHTCEVSEAPFDNAKVPGNLKVTDDPAYGPQGTRALKYKQEKGQYPSTKHVLLGPVENADSYAWFVVEAYFSLLCGQKFEAPTSNQLVRDGICPKGPNQCTVM
ncbi:hypothetical protein N7474_000734 [Penicillium riverlandense]|uniref:uncharacterized protein n=1 Tax=Penicillium riverlandense TaxID=1903569 RepID=UPI00254705A9|nr:uncharacterized protein N7474_000734 [Penicillium riverlandense]KAJ5832423.1 hypothetical protein N7474_000734 [Penicillium riverlandense]